MGVEDAHLHALADTDAAGGAPARWELVGRHLVGGLGHGVGFHDGSLQRGFECLEDLGLSGEEQLRTKRIFGSGLGSGRLSRIWWIVGTAVYQFA